jgi:hypothetical protein
LVLRSETLSSQAASFLWSRRAVSDVPKAISTISLQHPLIVPTESEVFRLRRDLINVTGRLFVRECEISGKRPIVVNPRHRRLGREAADGLLE